jgi:hypothetical protein
MCTGYAVFSTWGEECLSEGGFSLAIRLGKEAFFPVRVLLRFSIILEGLRSRARQTDVQSLGR